MCKEKKSSYNLQLDNPSSQRSVRQAASTGQSDKSKGSEVKDCASELVVKQVFVLFKQCNDHF